jgi:hypothetical protein
LIIAAASPNLVENRPDGGEQMSFVVWVMPVVTLVSGLAGLFLDPKDAKKRRMAFAWLIIVMAITVYLNWLDSADHERQKLAAERDAKNASQQIGMLISKVSNIGDFLQHSGLSPKLQEQVKTSASAETSRAKLLPQLQSGASGITVQYFYKDEDHEVVRKTLQLPGYQVIETPGKLAQPTNAIWVGDKVSINDVRYVALTLIRAGIGIKAIRYFVDPATPRKERLIQVGSSTRLADREPLTVDQVNAMSSLERDH